MGFLRKICGQIDRADRDRGMSDNYAYMGNYSAAEMPGASRLMGCHECKVEWTGCWDNFECPKCGRGEIPTDKTLSECSEELSLLIGDKDGK